MSARAAAPWGRQLRRGWDRLSIYLPVVLMGLLALGSYWLLRATPEPELPVAERPPQQFLHMSAPCEVQGFRRGMRRRNKREQASCHAGRAGIPMAVPRIRHILRRVPEQECPYGEHNVQLRG